MSANTIPRPEHPNPQWLRENWQNLNGTWQFHALTGPHDHLNCDITLPFCPESVLSGVHHTGFLTHVDYKRTIELTEEQLAGRVVVHVGAADYRTYIIANGKHIYTHEGGYTSFEADIAPYCTPGTNELRIECKDMTMDNLQMKGKQSEKTGSYGCNYTRTTGIWQTVWLEFTPKTHIQTAVFQPDPENACLHLRAQVEGKGTLTAKAYWEGKLVGEAAVKNCGNTCRLMLPLSEVHFWEVGKGGLYDLELSFGEDSVKSYFGLRTIALEGHKFLINGKSVFQRLVLDQGFYPDGIYTAPTAEVLENDIKLSMAAGFNGARLHQKVFEPLFHYYADKHGYLTWGEFADWGVDKRDPKVLHKFLPQWLEAVARDRNHPSIIGWCPYNETPEDQYRENISRIYYLTKSVDPDRPCIDTSGYTHVGPTDVYCIHDYDQNFEKLKSRYDRLGEGIIQQPHHLGNCRYDGQPLFLSEYGGIGWDLEGGWGYGETPKSREEFAQRYHDLTTALLENPSMFAFCYTQLTDVEQEHNGVYTYDRRPKFEDQSFYYNTNTQAAAIEN
ncbi:MAG: beta-galactosidase [Oscillospiraceae bacterium]|jgi:beta-galactosidase/beta-glucuronidase|nr:beta-galactosidase [Oscillospiraceae bacterium]